MHRTIFTTPGVNSVLRFLSITFLRLSGWKVEGEMPPDTPKCVLIGAPHTSNWDLPYTLMVGFSLRLNLYWMGKHSIFSPPLALRNATGTVQLTVPPEGTRSKTRYWKTGFYYIAQEAQVPIVMAYMDYANKRSGLGPVFHPTGDVERDMARIKAFYAPYKGRNPDQHGH